MKPRLLTTACIVLAFTAPSAFAANRWWDGGSVDILTDGNGAATASVSGTWSTGIANWDRGNALSHVAWVNSQNDVAVINNGSQGITLGSDVTVGGITQSGGASGPTISGSASNFKVTLGITGNNTFQINTGTTHRSLTISAEVTGASGNNILLNGGTLNLNGVNTFLGNISIASTTITAAALAVGGAGSLGSGNYAGNISIASATRSFNFNSSANQTLGGNITNAGTLRKGTSASSVLNLSGTNTGAGVIEVNAGTLTFRNTGARSATGTVTVAAGATLGLGVATSGSFFTSANVDSLFAGTLSGVTNDATSSVGIDTTQGSFTYATSVAGAPTRGLAKLGANTLTLTGNSTYTGATTVAAGVLEVNGSLANTSTTVGSTATLQGSGTIGGSVTIQAGGTLAAGNSIESLGVGALSFASGSNFAYEMQTNLYGSTPNVSADLTHSTGTLDITAGAILTLTDLATSTALANGSKFTLISYFGGWTGTELFTYNAATLNDGGTFTLGANLWEFNYNDTTGGPNYTLDQAGATHFVTLTVIPEPNVAALLGGLGLHALLRRRRN